MKVVMKVSVSINTYAKVWENVDNYRTLSYRNGGGGEVFSLLFLGYLVLSTVFHHLLKNLLQKAEVLGCSFHIQPKY